MGQYHLLVNLDKREFVYSHQLGDGLKAWEQFASGPGGVASAAVYLMVCPEPRGGGDFEESDYAGRWHGDRVTWVGDYAEKDDFAPVVHSGIEIHPDLIYDLCAKSDKASIVKHYLESEYVNEDKRDRFMEAANAGLWFTDITTELRAVMEDAMQGFMKYELRPWTMKRLDGSVTEHVSVDRVSAI